jgi:hypothetical protein
VGLKNCDWEIGVGGGEKGDEGLMVWLLDAEGGRCVCVCVCVCVAEFSLYAECQHW